MSRNGAAGAVSMVEDESFSPEIVNRPRAAWSDRREARILRYNKPKLEDAGQELPWLSLAGLGSVVIAVSEPREFVTWGRERIGKVVSYRIVPPQPVTRADQNKGGASAADWHEVAN